MSRSVNTYNELNEVWTELPDLVQKNDTKEKFELAWEERIEYILGNLEEMVEECEAEEKQVRKVITQLLKVPECKTLVGKQSVVEKAQTLILNL